MADGDATDLTADPGDSDRFYAGVLGLGVLTSDGTGGANWIPANNQALALDANGSDDNRDGIVDDPGESATGADRIVLSVQSDPTNRNNAVFAALIDNDRPMAVFRSLDAGSNWDSIGVVPDTNPVGQADQHFSMLADATGNKVYVGGDRRAATPFVGNLFVGDAETGNWTSIVLGAGSNLPAPHAGSRDLAFDASGRLVETDDGGVFRLSTPAPNQPSAWKNLNDGLTVSTGILSVAYDPLNNVVFAGSLTDRALVAQAAGNSYGTNWDLISAPYPDPTTNGRFAFVNGGGNRTRGSDRPRPRRQDDQVLRYAMGAGFGEFVARLYDASGHDITPASTLANAGLYEGQYVNGAGKPMVDIFGALRPEGTVGLRSSISDCGRILSGLGLTNRIAVKSGKFVSIPYVENAVDSQRMLTGLFSLYESGNRLETITTRIASTFGEDPRYTPGSVFTALAYGGRKNGEDCPERHLCRQGQPHRRAPGRGRGRQPLALRDPCHRRGRNHSSHRPRSGRLGNRLRHRRQKRLQDRQPRPDVGGGVPAACRYRPLLAGNRQDRRRPQDSAGGRRQRCPSGDRPGGKRAVERVWRQPARRVGDRYRLRQAQRQTAGSRGGHAGARRLDPDRRQSRRLPGPGQRVAGRTGPTITMSSSSGAPPRMRPSSRFSSTTAKRRPGPCP